MLRKNRIKAKTSKAIIAALLAMSIFPCSGYADTLSDNMKLPSDSSHEHSYDPYHVTDIIAYTEILYDTDSSSDTDISSSGKETIVTIPAEGSKRWQSEATKIILTRLVAENDLKVNDITSARKLNDGTIEIKIEGEKTLSDIEINDEASDFVKEHKEWFADNNGDGNSDVFEVIDQIAAGKTQYVRSFSEEVQKTTATKSAVSDYSSEPTKFYNDCEYFYDEEMNETVLIIPRDNLSDEELGAKAFKALSFVIYENDLKVEEVNQAIYLDALSVGDYEYEDVIEIRIKGVKTVFYDEDVEKLGSDSLSNWPDWFQKDSDGKYTNPALNTLTKIADGSLPQYCKANYCLSTLIQSPTRGLSKNEVHTIGFISDATQNANLSENDKLIKYAAVKALEACQSQGKCNDIDATFLANTSIAGIQEMYKEDTDLGKHMRSIWGYCHDEETGKISEEKINGYANLLKYDEYSIKYAARKAVEACVAKGECDKSYANIDWDNEELVNVGRIFKIAEGDTALGKYMTSIWKYAVDDSGVAADIDKLDNYAYNAEHSGDNTEFSAGEMKFLNEYKNENESVYQQVVDLLSDNKLGAGLFVLLGSIGTFAVSKGYGAKTILNFKNKLETWVRKFY